MVLPLVKYNTVTRDSPCSFRLPESDNNHIINLKANSEDIYVDGEPIVKNYSNPSAPIATTARPNLLLNVTFPRIGTKLVSLSAHCMQLTIGSNYDNRYYCSCDCNCIRPDFGCCCTCDSNNYTINDINIYYVNADRVWLGAWVPPSKLILNCEELALGELVDGIVVIPSCVRRLLLYHFKCVELLQWAYRTPLETIDVQVEYIRAKDFEHLPLWIDKLTINDVELDLANILTKPVKHLEISVLDESEFDVGDVVIPTTVEKLTLSTKEYLYYPVIIEIKSSLKHLVIDSICCDRFTVTGDASGLQTITYGKNTTNWNIQNYTGQTTVTLGKRISVTQTCGCNLCTGISSLAGP